MTEELSEGVIRKIILKCSCGYEGNLIRLESKMGFGCAKCGKLFGLFTDEQLAHLQEKGDECPLCKKPMPCGCDGQEGGR